ncbi:MAG: hypothetical protein HYV52_02265 [Parcubacteria group bacterium]|nr:hypothetical protein [Parcubacteria group bacterium]
MTQIYLGDIIKIMNKKVLFFVVIIIAVISISAYFWLQKADVLISTPASRKTSPTPTSNELTTKVKNPTIANSANDLVGNNNLESIGLIWDREEGAVEYVIFRSDFISGPFVEFRRIRAGIEIRANTEDITPDARTKTLCYKIEARDIAGKIIRIYEPICVPKWQE